MINEAPHALKSANDLLDVYAHASATMTHLERDHRFVECSTFADDIKSKGGSFQSGWHFIDTPFLDEGGSVEDYPNFKFEEDNVAAVIPAIIDWLQGKSGYNNTFVYKAIKNVVADEQ